MDGGTADEIIQGVGNEVFYFFMLLSLLLVIVGAWFSTQVAEPVVSSVILVERAHNSNRQRGESDPNSEFIQYRLQPSDTRSAGSASNSPNVSEAESASSSGGVGRPSSRRVQENFVADLQRITEPLQNTSQTTETDRRDGAPNPQCQEEILDPIPDEERVTVRLKFLNDTERDVEASLLENLATFRRRNFIEEISENKIIRFIFNGQMLREESSTLQSYGMFDKCVVHCLIQQPPAAARSAEPQQHQQQPHSQAHDEEQDFDISELFIPVLGFGLIVLWYLAFTYSTYFNSMSTSALLGLTSLFLFTLYGTSVHINVVTRN